MGRSSTDSGDGWRFSECPPELIDNLSAELGISGRGNARIAALRDRLSDRDWLSSQLKSRSPFQLVILESLLDLGAIAPVDILWQETCRRLRLERSQDDRDIVAATAVVGCTLGAVGSPLVALFAPSVEPLRLLLQGVSLPSPGEAPDESIDARLDVRDRIVAAARTGQRRVKATKSGDANRANRRKFERDVTAVGTALWDHLERAINAELTTVDAAQRVVPDLAEIRRVAEHGFIPRDSWSAATLAGLERGRAIPVDHFVRARQRELCCGVRRPDNAVPRHDTWMVIRAHHMAGALGGNPGVWAGELDGHPMLAVPAAGEDGDGHVLPDFSVMLGPRTSLTTVATVACGAELVRLDRIATFRLTPDSVRAAVILGVSCDELLAALDRVGPRDTPETVRRSIEEWAERIDRGRIVRDRVVVVSEMAERRLLREAGEGQGPFERLAPGVLRVIPSVTEHALHTLLEDAGVTVAPEIAGSSETGAPEVASSSAKGAGRVSLDAPGRSHDEDAHARVQAAMASGDFPEMVYDDGPDDGLCGFIPPAGVAAQRFDAEVEVVRAALRRWHGKLAVKARAKVKLDRLLEDEEIVPTLAAVHPSARGRILSRATKPAQIRRRVDQAIASGKLADFMLGVDDVTPADFPAMAPRELRHALEICAETEEPVRLLLVYGAVSEVTPELQILAIEPRGRDVFVDAEETETELGHSYPLTSIRSVLATDDGVSVGNRGLETIFESLARNFRR